MDFKKFLSDAGTSITRAVQMTEEKLGAAEKTEYDAHFENLLQRCDQTQSWTEKILASTEAVLQPNPTLRAEDILYDKLEKKKRDRNNTCEDLSEVLGGAGTELGPSTAYGNALIKCSQAEQRIGQAEREFIHLSTTSFLQPLKNFLDTDLKTIQKERKTLENLRLDLDSCKGKLKKAKSDAAKKAAENDLQVAQAEFDRQLEVTKLLLEGIRTTHGHHQQCLNEFIEAQMNYYAQCHQYMQELHRQLESS